jgi:hypothetical protein
MTDDELYKDILHRWNTLADAVEKLYFAGYWHCDRPVDEKALWQAVRDAARIPPGMTGYTLGEDRSSGPESEAEAACAAMVKWCDKNDWGSVPKKLEERLRNACRATQREGDKS